MGAALSSEALMGLLELGDLRRQGFLTDEQYALLVKHTKEHICLAIVLGMRIPAVKHTKDHICLANMPCWSSTQKNNVEFAGQNDGKGK